MKPASDTPPQALPYVASKPVGAADFYFAINATFRFILERFGMEKLRQYWRELGANYLLPVSTAWQQQGLPGVAEYWRAFFRAEPGADVEVALRPDVVVVEVRKCPAITHLRQNGRSIVPCFCQHCYFVGEATAAPAGLTLRVKGGNGSCQQTFLPRRAGLPDQDLALIQEARC